MSANATTPLRLPTRRAAQPDSPDPVVCATAEATTPDLAALAALDAYLTRFGIACATSDRKLPEEEGQSA